MKITVAALIGALVWGGPLDAQTRDETPISENLDLGPGAEILTGAARAEALRAVERYLNGIDTLSGRFFQIAADGGLSQGDVFMRRPHRARFDYDDPVPLLIVADGTWVGVIDEEIDQVERIPIGATPLDIVLADEIDIEKAVDTRLVARDSGYLIVHARSRDEEADGEVTLVFAEPRLELRQWIVRDAAGRATSVSFSDLTAGDDLAPDLFRIEEPEGDDFFGDDDD